MTVQWLKKSFSFIHLLMENKEKGVIIIEGHVQGLANLRSLGKKGIPVIVIDKEDCIARYSKYCKKFFQCPDFKSDELADFLLELATKENLEGWFLLPSNDHIVITLARNLNRLSEKLKLFTSNLEIINLVTDKVRLSQLAHTVGIDIPKIFNLEEVENYFSKNTTENSILVRGKSGLQFYKTFKKKVFRLKTKDDYTNFQQLFENSGLAMELLFQEEIPGNAPTYSVACFCIEGEVRNHWVGLKRRQHPLEFGTATLAESAPNAELVELAKKLIRATNYNGICEIEFLFHEVKKKYCFIELNPRTWLWVDLAIHDGVDFPYLAYSHVNDIPLNKKYLQGNEILKWRNPITDFVFGVKALLSRKITISQFIHESYRGRIVDALFQKGDFRPGLHYFRLLFAFNKKR